MILLRLAAFWAVLYSLKLTYNLTINFIYGIVFFALGTISFQIINKSYLKGSAKVIISMLWSGIMILTTYFFSLLFDHLEFEIAWRKTDILLALGFYVYGIVSVSIIYLYNSYLILEGLLLLLFTFLSLEAVRGLNFSSSKFIYDWASFLETNEINFAAIFAGVLVVLYLVALFFRSNSKLQKRTIILWIFISTLIGFLASKLTILEYKNASTHPMGVGFEDSENDSPLSFDSFVGSSQQATALIKLGFNYIDQRTSPIIYFRENAVSKFNGRELTSSEFDSDIPKEGPLVPQSISIFDELKSFRIELTSKVYLLHSHSRPFGIDIPISFNPIPNPNPEKFVGGSYTVLSWAPNFTDFDLTDKKLGARYWSKREWAHYTEKHQDPRYQQLAFSIVGNETKPLLQIFKLVEYINKNYIYTVKPNHNVGKNEDPVAPFLFGDRRGYCVHIAHALVYMMRSLEIPSRIGLGYASDLSESRDGYLLLRMNDRHAWAEVYFDSIGWVVFDAQPEQVESHRVAPVDQDLLKSLIEKVEGLDIEEKRKEEKVDVFTGIFRLGWYLPLLLVLFYLALKFYLWYGYLIFRTKKYLALSIVSRLYDKGYQRKNTQTLEEFINSIPEISHQEIVKVFFEPGTAGQKDIKTGLFHFLNPNSVIRYFLIGRW